MKRRVFLQAASAGLVATLFGRAARSQASGKTFLVAHGAWSGGWAWKRMHPLMTAAGHRLLTPTYTGLGEHAHLANPSIDLTTHIEDVLGVIKYEDLRDFVLVGHSYGGMVATGVADRAAERISRIVYLDAFVPKDGQSLYDLISESARQRSRRAADLAGDGWQIPPNPIPPDTSREDAQWLERLRVPQPIKCFETPLPLRNGDTKLPRSYIYCKRAAPDDNFRQFANRAKQEHWDYHEIDASHAPYVTAPQALAALFDTIAKMPGNR
jgi:pimeloyl-ACP methyl ester carboxylesterase